VGLVGVLALMVLAQRYTKILVPRVAREDSPGLASPSSGPSSSTPSPMASRVTDSQATSRLVEAFVAVRSEMYAALPAVPQPDSTLIVSLREVRDHALGRARLPRDDYYRLLSGYLDWKKGRVVKNPQLARAFDRRRASFERLDLGRFEGL
jgi:hypothetical protein